MRPTLFGILLLGVFSLPVQAQDRVITLLTTQSTHDSGLLGYILPRFKLKTGIAVEFVTGDTAEIPDGIDLVLSEAFEGQIARSQPVMFSSNAADTGGQPYMISLLSDAGSEDAIRFVDWLLSDVGQNTVAAYQVDNVQVFVPYSDVDQPVAEVVLQGDALVGDKLAHFACGRCHVVSERNRMGGIGSTPSFAAMRNFPDWKDKFLGFYALNPHPSFTQVEDVTEPFSPDRPPHIAPVELTLDEIDAIAAYVATIEPKDLGGNIRSQ